MTHGPDTVSPYAPLPLDAALPGEEAGGTALATSLVPSLGTVAMALGEPQRVQATLDMRGQVLDKIEAFIRARLRPGDDFGVAHDRKTCRNLSWQEWGRCPSCGRKPDLWLGGAERLAFALGLDVSEPELATDLMGALRIEGPWLCARVRLIRRGTGEIVGTGWGARTLAQDGNDPNKTIKMLAKSALIDVVKRTFALSSFFTQDGSGGDESAAPAAPGPAPILPIGSASTLPGTVTIVAGTPNYEAEARALVTQVGATPDERAILKRLASIPPEQTADTWRAAEWAAMRDVLRGFLDVAKAGGHGPKSDPAALREVFVGWLAAQVRKAEAAVHPPTAAERVAQAFQGAIVPDPVTEANARCLDVLGKCGLTDGDLARFWGILGVTTDAATRWVPLARLLDGSFRTAMGQVPGWQTLDTTARAAAARAWLAAREAEQRAK